jgi:hypothetical protein
VASYEGGSIAQFIGRSGCKSQVENPRFLNENYFIILFFLRNSTPASGYAFLGDATDIRYQVLTNCDLQMVGEEFSRKPYAVAVQQGSPLKDQFNNA